MKRTRKTIKHKIASDRPKIPRIAFIVVVPLVIAVATFYYIFGPDLSAALANRGNNRLTTLGWQSAQQAMTAAKPTYGPKFSYYKLQEGQDLNWAAKHFSVSLAKLQQLNPGQAVWGTTIIVPPVEQPYAPFPASAETTANIIVTQANGVLYVTNKFTNAEAYVTIPDIMQLVQPYGGITKLGPKTFLINKPLYIQNNIQMDITSATVNNLYLLSSPDYDITTLTFQSSEALLDGVHVSSYDPATKKPDTDYQDGRSFLRAYDSGRMDILHSTVSYLGMTKVQAENPALRARLVFISQGGVYGASWRIGTGTFGDNDVTGWVQDSTFEHNYIGAFTFGAQGMMWQGNLFTANHVYGLDPHDDSDNATIEYNRFVANGKHGFIVSKRCDYNLIRDNISIDNALHGFMLHDNSDYNIFENNISIGNYDNFVMYNSNFDMVLNNKGYNPRGSQVRINQASVQDYIVGNSFYGGARGIYLYGNDNGADITGNTFDDVNYELDTNGATRVLYTGNQSNGLGYKLGKGDRVVFGINTINKHPGIDLTPLQTITNGQKNHIPLTQLAATARTQ